MKTMLLSSLEKVFIDREPTAQRFNKASALKSELFHFQLAFSIEEEEREILKLKINSELEVDAYVVQSVASQLPVYQNRHDDDNLGTKPTLFPDLLTEFTQDVTISKGLWKSLWFEVLVSENEKAGVYPIEITLYNDKHKITEIFELEVINETLPAQKLISYQWFHNDCLASYYQCEVFSDRHWELIENYMENAAKYGTNMILCPVFTPMLDTDPGAYRPCVQLVGIEKLCDGSYVFDYDKLERYISTAKKYGITHFGMAHLFTQWGAKFTPKIQIKVDGKLQNFFGWECGAQDGEYKKFLTVFLPSLKQKLDCLGVLETSCFHISDEPSSEHLESYKVAKSVVKELLADCKIYDALSDFEFYKEGAVENPIPATDHIQPFLDANVEDLWTYYCCAQGVDVSNRFMAFPSYRNRIIGHQLFLYDIKGFLHWGYNFWYSFHSKELINPYLVTDAHEAFPSGDAFLVYPGANGKPQISIRQAVFYDALQDMRAFELLCGKIGKENTKEILCQDQEITFESYPRSADFILSNREKINKALV